MKFLVVRFPPGGGGKFLCTCLQASSDVHAWEPQLEQAKLSNTVLEPEKNIYYLNLINQRLSKIYEILNVKEKNKDTELENIVNDIKPPIFWKDKPPLLAQLKKWSKDKVKYVLNKTYNAEIQIKSSSLIDKNIIMKKLIVDICKLANS